MLQSVTWRAAVVGRWTALILGTLMVLLFLAFFFGEGPPNFFHLTTSERVIAGDELEDPVVTLVVHSDLIIRMDGIGRGVTRDVQRLQQGIQEQDHILPKLLAQRVHNRGNS